MTSSASGMATGHGLEELNWQQLEQKSHTPAVLDLISLDDVPSQSHLWKLLLKYPGNFWCDGYRRTGNLVRTSTNESGGVYKSETGLFVATRSGLEKDLVQVSGETFDVLGSVDVGQVSLSDCVLPTTAGQGLKTNQKGELVLETTTGPDGFFIGGPLYDDVDYNIEASKRTRDLDTAELLEQIPALQQLLFRVLGCQFFEMPRHDAVLALDIYRRAGQQAERLSEFYEICKSIDLGRGERFIKIEQISGFLLVPFELQAPASFLTAMEEYVRDAPRASSVHSNKKRRPSPTISPPAETVEVEIQTWVSEPPDLLGLNDATPYASDLDEKNAFALAIVPVATPSADAPLLVTILLVEQAGSWHLLLPQAQMRVLHLLNKLEYSFSPSAHVIELGSGESKEVVFQATHVAYSAMGTISLLSGQPKEGVFVEARSESKVKVVAKEEWGSAKVERASPEFVTIRIIRSQRLKVKNCGAYVAVKPKMLQATPNINNRRPVENIGAELVRQGGSKTNDLAWNGTITSVVPHKD
ncbi:hypothetical protein IFM89_018614 [Coptis chinensis]|uniref:AP180 N-terminal homology (ANTH) domain-containing protein n=1 Tax=Coptis chinensis TaxID=261450 RepID=A0A835LEU1_9MAGN|nr:hypothetical protein IFM89_018614 [Coptis chinensis]